MEQKIPVAHHRRSRRRPGQAHRTGPHSGAAGDGAARAQGMKILMAHRGVLAAGGAKHIALAHAAGGRAMELRGRKA